METPSPSFRIAPFAVGAVAVLALAAVAGLLLLKREASVMEPAAAVGRSEPAPDRLWQPDGRTRGNLKAPVTLIEYSDFTCGYCAKFFRETWPRLREKYVDTGKVRLLYRDYPRDPDGPAMTAAIAARCAGDQGRYWDMHDRLFAGRIEMDVLQAHAKAIGLNQPAFATCLRDAPHRQAILQDKADGIRIGFVGTPGFVLLRTGQAGGEKPIGLPGAFPADVFEQEIERLLKPPAAAQKG
jgi:protein-disulfide isomerase